MSDKIAYSLRVSALSKRYLSADGKGAATWALKDIAFSLEKGKCLGILGPNGSGKSTLLRLIAGHSTPTQGSIQYHGRLAAILDVGLGFHPDLTGIDNVFLSGQLMGLSKRTIRHRLQRVLDFAGIGDAIHAAVKTYSSGMYVRLAFAVASQLSADILILDEVLGVGDLAFQAQCREVFYARKKSGQTLVIVSHNLHELRNIADEYLLLDKGHIRYTGKDKGALDTYIKSSLKARLRSKKCAIQLPLTLESEGIRIHALECRAQHTPTHHFYPHDSIQISLNMALLRLRTPPWVVYHLQDFSGQTLSTLPAHLKEDQYTQYQHSLCYRCVLAHNSLNPGMYGLSLYLIDFYNRQVRFHLPWALSFCIEPYAQSMLNELFCGPVRLPSQWTLVKNPTL